MLDPDYYHSPEFEAEVASHALSLRGTQLTVILAFVTGTGFTLFGYIFCSSISACMSR